MLRLSTRKATAAVATILIVGGAGAATAAALDGSPTVGIALPAIQQHTDAPDHPAPYYSAVAQSTQKPTARVSEMVDHVLAERFPDVADRPVRGIRAADGTQAWVVSGSKYTCLGADNSEGTGYTCSPNGEALDGVSIAERREDGTQRTIALVPDRIASVSADGADVEPPNNLVITEHRAGSPVEAHPADGGSPFRIGTE